MPQISYRNSPEKIHNLLCINQWDTVFYIYKKKCRGAGEHFKTNNGLASNVEILNKSKILMMILIWMSWLKLTFEHSNHVWFGKKLNVRVGNFYLMRSSFLLAIRVQSHWSLSSNSVKLTCEVFGKNAVARMIMWQNMYKKLLIFNKKKYFYISDIWQKKIRTSNTPVI
jgi:hypothetical protein